MKIVKNVVIFNDRFAPFFLPLFAVFRQLELLTPKKRSLKMCSFSLLFPFSFQVYLWSSFKANRMKWKSCWINVCISFYSASLCYMLGLVILVQRNYNCPQCSPIFSVNFVEIVFCLWSNDFSNSERSFKLIIMQQIQRMKSLFETPVWKPQFGSGFKLEYEK